MPKIRVDFSKANSFEVLPAGQYPVVVDEVEEREGPKARYLNWTLKVETGEYAGRKVWMSTSLLDTAAWSLKAALQAMGETDPEIVGPDVKFVEFDPDDYLGRRIIANVSQSTRNNRVQNDVDSVSPNDSEMPSGTRRSPAMVR